MHCMAPYHECLSRVRFGPVIVSSFDVRELWDRGMSFV